MISNKKESQSLINLIRNKSGEHEMPITQSTLIEEDLGITGSDAEELIVQLSKEYNVDITGFNFLKYFNDEPSIFDTNRMTYPLTVGHLEKAIIAGRLDEEIINS